MGDGSVADSVNRRAEQEAARTAGLDPADLKRLAKVELHQRQLRGRIFGRSLSREVAWDMLLALFAYDHRLTVSALTVAAEAAPTTALRWIDYLEDRALISRTPHPTDLRSSFVELTADAERMMGLYLIETSQAKA